MEIEHVVRVRVAPLAVVLAAGALLGVAGPLAGKFGNPVCHVLSLVFSGGWSWAALAFLVGYFRRSKVESALLASAALAVGVIVYYLFKVLSPAAPIGGVIAGGSEDGFSSKIVLWGLAAFVFGAPVGFLGNLARVPGIGGLGFRLLIPLIAYFETSQRLRTEADSQGRIVEMTWYVIRFAAVGVAIALVVHTVWCWWRARRNRSEGYAEAGARHV